MDSHGDGYYVSVWNAKKRQARGRLWVAKTPAFLRKLVDKKAKKFHKNSGGMMKKCDNINTLCAKGIAMGREVCYDTCITKLIGPAHAVGLRRREARITL